MSFLLIENFSLTITVDSSRTSENKLMVFIINTVLIILQNFLTRKFLGNIHQINKFDEMESQMWYYSVSFLVYRILEVKVI
jgi:hypothetical protein